MSERAVTAIYLLLLLAIYAIAGTSDRQEAERLSMQGYVEERLK